MNHDRYHKNVPGDFYTTGDCLACELPEHECPECLAPLDDDNYDTYFVKQPENLQEIENACRAAETCCVSAIRYGGNNPEILKRLGNRLEYCDSPMPGGPIRFSWESDESWESAQSDYASSSEQWYKRLMFWKK